MTPRPIHPGELLREEFLPEYGLTAGSLAKALDVPRDRIEKIIRKRRSITADTAARLAQFFETTPQFWLNLQSNHDLALLYQDGPLPNIQPVAKSTAAHSAAGFADNPQEPLKAE